MIFMVGIGFGGWQEMGVNGSVSWQEGETAAQLIDELFMQDIRGQSGYAELTQMYGQFVTSLYNPDTFRVVNRFQEEFNNVLVPYFNVLTTAQKGLQQAYELALANQSLSVTPGAYYDVTVFNEEVAAFSTIEQLKYFAVDTDEFDDETRASFLTANNTRALLYAFDSISLDESFNASLGQIQKATSIFFAAEGITMSYPAINFHAEGETADTFEAFVPEFRSWYVQAATAPKMISIIVLLPGSKNVVYNTMINAVETLLNSLSDSDFATIIVDRGTTRYVYTCDNTSEPTLYRTKAEFLPTMRQFLLDYATTGLASTNDAFNLTLNIHETFTVSCTSPSSQITIFYILSSSASTKVPDGTSVRRLWNTRPINNRIFVIDIHTNRRQINEGVGLKLKDLACKNSGVLVRGTPDEDTLHERLYDIITFLNNELQPTTPVLSVGKGWRQDSPELNLTLTWTLTLPVYSAANVFDNDAVSLPLIGVVGIDLPPTTFATVLFRAQSFTRYSFVLTTDLDVVLHPGMNLFDWNTPDVVNPDPPFTQPIDDYETAKIRDTIYQDAYLTEDEVTQLEVAIAANPRGFIYFSSPRRGYTWLSNQYLRLITVSTYYLEPELQLYPSIPNQVFFPQNRDATICDPSLPSPSFQAAVPVWSPNTASSQFANGRQVPTSSPLAINQYRNVTIATGDGLPQRTWNISGAYYFSGAFVPDSPPGASVEDLAEISQYLIEGAESLLSGEPTFLTARALFDATNQFLTCASKFNPFLTAAAVADTEITGHMQSLWSDFWLNGTSDFFQGLPQPRPFLYSVLTQNSVFRFWPVNDAISMAPKFGADLYSTTVPSGRSLLSSVLTQPGGAIQTSVTFPLRTFENLPADLANVETVVPPVALLTLRYEYTVFHSFFFNAVMPGCYADDQTRCYVVDSALQVLLASDDIHLFCTNKFAFEFGTRSLANIEPNMVRSMLNASLAFADDSSATFYRIDAEVAAATTTSFSFGSPGCPAGDFFMWALSDGSFLVAVFNSNIPSNTICDSQYSVCDIPLPEWALDNTTCPFIPEGAQFSCPTSDRSQQLLEELRPKQLKCFDDPIFETLQFSDPLSIVLYGVYTIFAIVVVLLMIVFIKYRHTSVVESSNVIFVFTTLAGTLFATVSVFFWIGTPNDSICIARMWFAVCSFSIISGMMFAKILYVYLNIKDPKVLRIKMPDRLLVAYALLASVPQILVVLIWTAYDPLQPKVEVEPTDYGTLDQPTAQTLCVSDTSSGFYITLFALEGILLLVGAVLTLTTRKTKSLWNESTWIGLTVYATAIVYPTVILLRELVNGTPTQEFLILFVGVFIVVACVIGFVFCTKAYVIFFTPDLNDTAARIAEEINTDFQPRIDD